MRWPRRTLAPAGSTELALTADSPDKPALVTWEKTVELEDASRRYLAGEALMHAEFAAQATDAASFGALNNFPKEADAFSRVALAHSATSQAYSALLGALRPGDLPLDDEAEG